MIKLLKQFEQKRTTNKPFAWPNCLKPSTVITFSNKCSIHGFYPKKCSNGQPQFFVWQTVVHGWDCRRVVLNYHWFYFKICLVLEFRFRDCQKYNRQHLGNFLEKFMLRRALIFRWNKGCCGRIAIWPNAVLIFSSIFYIDNIY